MKIKDMIFRIESLSFKEVLEYIVESVGEKEKKTFIVTINPEIIMLAMKDKDYENVLKSSDLALADGVGVVLAGKMFGKSFKGRVHGADLVEKVSEAVAGRPITVGFLGGRGNVAEEVSLRLKKKYPGLQIVFAVEEWEARGPSFAKASAGRPAARPSELEERSGVGSPSSSVTPRCDILFVAFGSPKQEKWIYENLPKINVRLAIGVGGAFDFISGRVRRAPVWVRSVGLEWLFRLIIQPWRIKRQLALAKFVILVLRERFL